MRKAVFFDLDGTVIDTIFDITDAMNFMLEKYGFSPITTDKMKACLGGPTTEIVRLAIGQEIDSEKLEECSQVYAKYYIESKSPKTIVFKGMARVIKALKEKGFLVFALSNKPNEEIAPLVDRLLNPLGFDEVIGLDENVIPKPNPTQTLLTLEKYGVAKQNAYFVGDGETDIMTGLNAKITTIGVLWGNRDEEFLKSFGAKIFVQTPNELLEIIK